MPRFEITYLCKDEDWLGWRVDAQDFHEAARAAFSRLDMANLESELTVHPDAARPPNSSTPACCASSGCRTPSPSNYHYSS